MFRIVIAISFVGLGLFGCEFQKGYKADPAKTAESKTEKKKDRKYYFHRLFPFPPGQETSLP